MDDYNVSLRERKNMTYSFKRIKRYSLNKKTVITNLIIKII